MSHPPMSHLPGFWNPRNWSHECWAEYQRRRRGWHNRLANRVDQHLHRLLGEATVLGLYSRERWEAREAAQWPSATGAWDPCEDHIAFCKGAGYTDEAAALLAAARTLRSEFPL